LVAQAVVQSGLGVSLAPDELTAQGLRASLNELLTSDAGARRQLAAAAEAYSAAARSADLVESLIGPS
jgi:UDP:flavonoid glycosyltransferase YjiC (YdhE family)